MAAPWVGIRRCSVSAQEDWGIVGAELAALETGPAAVRWCSTVLNGNSQSWEDMLRNSQ